MTNTSTLFQLAIAIGVGLPSMSYGTLYCNRAYAELPENPGRPLNAVGFLNNGCTAVLVGPHHIATAAHCLVDTGTGRWQTGLRFYPNFHPDRVTRDPYRVPHATVARAVVGSRAGENMLGSGMDWGIARLENWQNTTGMDLTPISLSANDTHAAAPLTNPAYTRHHFPFDDADATTWDNMEWDNLQCSSVGVNRGMWAMQMRPAPFVGGNTRDMVGCNSRWVPGTIHANCSVSAENGGIVTHNCDTVGGSSGSPLIVQPAGGPPSLIGIGHGGGPADFSLLAPTCTPDTPANANNFGPSVTRFRNAPRFASNVAVHRRPDNRSATMVFAVDADTNRVVARARSGRNPAYEGPFEYWKSIGSPQADATLSKIAACSFADTARPQIFVIANGTKIFTTSATASGQWGAWTEFALPPGVTNVSDIDATTDATGRCAVIVAAEPGAVYFRTQPAANAWGPWLTVAAGSYRSVTALNYRGTVQAAFIDGAGEISHTRLESAGWTAPTRLARPAQVSGWRDIDMTWDEAGRGFMVATPSSGGDILFFVPMYGTAAWEQWRTFATRLWAPGRPPQPAPQFLSLTAARWMEDAPGVTSPVVFATDDQGNVYFIEFARVGTVGWNLSWKSFYHETIKYP